MRQVDGRERAITHCGQIYGQIWKEKKSVSVPPASSVGECKERSSISLPPALAWGSAMRSGSKGPTLRTETQKRDCKEVRYKGLGRMRSGRETECVTSQLTLLAPWTYVQLYILSKTTACRGGMWGLPLLLSLMPKRPNSLIRHLCIHRRLRFTLYAGVYIYG